MKRTYNVTMIYQAKGDRYELMKEVGVEATSAGRAADAAYKRIKDESKGDLNRRVREVSGGRFVFKVFVGARADLNGTGGADAETGEV